MWIGYHCRFTAKLRVCSTCGQDHQLRRQDRWVHSCASSMLKPSNLSRVFISLQGKVHVTFIISDNVISLSACEQGQRWTSVAPVEVSSAEVLSKWNQTFWKKSKQINEQRHVFDTSLHQLYSKLVLWKLHLDQLQTRSHSSYPLVLWFPPWNFETWASENFGFFQVQFRLFSLRWTFDMILSTREHEQS